jgi:hypothetical protein
LEKTSLSLAALQSFSEKREKEAVARPVTRNALVRKRKGPFLTVPFLSDLYL